MLRALRTEGGWHSWLAEDRQGQQVVVTVWPEWNSSNAEARSRMMREAAICSRLQHPGVVPLLGYAEQGDWFWWIRPADIGRPLSELMSAPLKPARVVDWLGQLTTALAYAHQNGVVHPRLDPDCIWVNEERVRISEFAFTQPETPVVHMGYHNPPSPRFMAPEQIMGGPVTPASNYFTLGSIAFELLSGRPLFTANDPIQLMFKILHEELPSFEHLPPALGELLTRLLERPSEKRLSDPAAILGYLGGDFTSAASGPEMQGVLADLRAEGQTVSENEVFTLDPGRALEKLGHFRFPEEWEWLVSLCAAASALEAQKLSLEWAKKGLTLAYQGVRLSQQQLQDFWISAYAAHQGGTGYLARGLASALTQHQGGWVEVASAGWKLRTGEVQKERLGRGLATHLQIRFEGCPEPDWDQVRRRFLYTPLPICWQGKWQSTVVANRSFPLPEFSLRVDLVETPQWLAVVDGMSFPMEQLVPESGRLVVWGPLHLDADRRALLKDERLAEVCLHLKAEVESAVEEFALAPRSSDPLPTRLYRRALALWEERGEEAKIDQFASAYLNLVDGGAAPTRMAEECFRRAAGWQTPPESFWRLACLNRWFPLLEADWGRAMLVSERAFAKEHARLHWLLQCWLEWGEVKPDSRQLGSLLNRFSGQRLDARFDPLLVERLPEDAAESWVHLLPKHWTLSRSWFRQRAANLSSE